MTREEAITYLKVIWNTHHFTPCKFLSVCGEYIGIIYGIRERGSYFLTHFFSALYRLVGNISA